MDNNKNNNIIYIKSYSNPYDNRKSLYKDNKNKSGVYCWENKITGKLYIGSSKNITKRLYEYFSLNGINYLLARSKSLILSSMLKYGYINFNFHIVLYCNKDQLISREQYYIDLVKPEYNLRKFAYSPLEYKHTPETILKLKSYKPSIETLAKLRSSKELCGNIVIVVDKESFKLNKYPSLNSAARALNVNKQMLHYYIKRNTLLKNKYLIIKLIRFEY